MPAARPEHFRRCSACCLACWRTGFPLRTGKNKSPVMQRAMPYSAWLFESSLYFFQTAICFLPLRLRAERTFLPPAVLILDLKPCTLARCLFLGWNVIFAIFISSLIISKWYDRSFITTHDHMNIHIKMNHDKPCVRRVRLRQKDSYCPFFGKSAPESHISLFAPEIPCRLLRHIPDRGYGCCFLKKYCFYIIFH